jgi:hypothetical protein
MDGMGLLERAVLQIVERTPALIALIYLSIQYGRHQRQSQAEYTKYQIHRDEIIKEVSTRCHEQQQLATAATRKNSEVLAHVVEVLRQCPGIQHLERDLLDGG